MQGQVAGSVITVDDAFMRLTKASKRVKLLEKKFQALKTQLSNLVEACSASVSGLEGRLRAARVAKLV